MISKLNLNTVANITAILQILPDDSNSLTWVCNNYFSLLWEENSDNNLQICGYDGLSPYDEISNCPFITSKKINISQIEEKICLLLEHSYGILLPINTKKMGVTNKAFYHDVFLSDINEGHVTVYDFWPPSFKWKPEKYQMETLLSAIDYSKCQRYPPLAVKFTPCRIMDRLKVNEIAENYLYSCKSGIVVYEKMIYWIESLEGIYYLNHINFVTLFNHFKVWEFIIDINDKQCVKHNSVLAKELTRSVMHLRNISMKYWYSTKPPKNWKEQFIDGINEIREKEKIMLKNIV